MTEAKEKSMKADVKSAGGSFSWFYSDVVKDHFMNPRNLAKTDEEIEEIKPNGVGEVGSPACGDIMRVWIHVENDRITACRWRTFGCASAMASTSMMSEMITENGGMTLDDADQIRPKDIVERLGGLPKIKFHCSVLGDQALRKAIEDYKSKKLS